MNGIGVIAALVFAASAVSDGATVPPPTPPAPSAVLLSPEEAKAVDDLFAEYHCHGTDFLRGRDLSHLGPTAFSLSIGVDGAVKSAVVIQSSGDRILDWAAAKCVQIHWHYKPAIKDGKPVESVTKAQIQWRRGP